MLLKPKIIRKPSDVVIFKLVTSEEVIGKIVSETDDTITISKALTTHQIQSGTGFGIALGPFMPAADHDEDTIFPKSSLICEPKKAAPEIEANYTKMTSNLIVPV